MPSLVPVPCVPASASVCPVGSESDGAKVERDAERALLLARGRVPEPDLLRGVAGGQELAIRRESDRPDLARDAGKLGPHLEIGRVVDPDASRSALAVSVRDSQALAVGREGNLEDLLGQRRERSDHLARAGIPDVEHSLGVARDQHLPVGRERQGPDRRPRILHDEERLVVRRVPDHHVAMQMARGQGLAIRRKCRAP